MHQNEDMFQCKYCDELVNLAWREFILAGESTTIQYFESCCMSCAEQKRFKVITDPAMREILEELSQILGDDPIQLAAPGPFTNQHGVGPEDLEADITDQTQPHYNRPTRKTDRDDAKRIYRGIMRGIRDLRGKQAEEPLTPTQAQEYRCKSNEESEHKFPIRSNWKPSEVPDSIQDYWKKRMEFFERWAKLELQPDGSFKEPEEK